MNNIIIFNSLKISCLDTHTHTHKASFCKRGATICFLLFYFFIGSSYSQSGDGGFGSILSVNQTNVKTCNSFFKESSYLKSMAFDRRAHNYIIIDTQSTKITVDTFNIPESFRDSIGIGENTSFEVVKNWYDPNTGDEMVDLQQVECDILVNGSIITLRLVDCFVSALYGNYFDSLVVCDTSFIAFEEFIEITELDTLNIPIDSFLFDTLVYGYPVIDSNNQTECKLEYIKTIRCTYSSDVYYFRYTDGFLLDINTVNSYTYEFYGNRNYQSLPSNFATDFNNFSLSNAPYENGTIIGYAFYLMINGGTHNGIYVAPIGGQKSANILFRFVKKFLQNNHSFQQTAIDMILSAEELYGKCSPEAKSVTNAFASVSLFNPWTSEFTLSGPSKICAEQAQGGGPFPPQIYINALGNNTHNCVDITEWRVPFGWQFVGGYSNEHILLYEYPTNTPGTYPKWYKVSAKSDNGVWKHKWIVFEDCWGGNEPKNPCGPPIGATNRSSVIENNEKHFDANHAIELYPNPGRGVINTNYPAGTIYSIFDVNGREVSRGSVKADGVIDVTQLNNGVQFILIKGITHKYIKF